MTVERMRRIYCDVCRAKTNPVPCQDRDPTPSTKGWLVSQCYGYALHLCPRCAAQPLPDWWPDESGMHFHWEL